MAFRLIAFHYPRPDHHSEMIERIRSATAVLVEQPGCHGVEMWQEEPGGAVVALGVWDSKEQAMAGFDAVSAAGVDLAFDEREERPRQVHNLVEPT